MSEAPNLPQGRAWRCALITPDFRGFHSKRKIEEGEKNH